MNEITALSFNEIQSSLKAQICFKDVILQNTALLVTGAIWTRYSFVIVPINYYLASVCSCVGAIGFIQLSRIAHYQVHSHYVRFGLDYILKLSATNIGLSNGERYFSSYHNFYDRKFNMRWFKLLNNQYSNVIARALL